MIRLYAISVAIGILAMISVYQAIKQSGRVEGQQKERARVETTERKLDAKINRAKRAVPDKPSASVLDKWSRP
mgnify:CR=1 FL=1